MSSSEDSRAGSAVSLRLPNGSAAASKKGAPSATIQSLALHSNGSRGAATSSNGAESSRPSQTRAIYAGMPPASAAATAGARAAARASARQSLSQRGTSRRNRIQHAQPTNETDAVQADVNDNQIGDLSAVRLHPGVVQSTWHTSTDSKTEFDVGDSDEDPNIITTRVTTVTTTTTVTTFTSPRTTGPLDYAASAHPAIGSSRLAIMPSILPAEDDNLPQNSTPPPETVSGKASRRVNGSRPRVSFALDVAEEGDDDDRDGYDGGDDEVAGDENPEEEGEGEEEDEVDELEEDDDRMSTDELSQHSNSTSPLQTRRRDRDDDEEGAGAGSARGTAVSTRRSARASNGAASTAAGNQSSGTMTRRSGRNSGGTTRTEAPSSSAPSSLHGGMANQKHLGEQDLQDLSKSSAVLAARGTGRGKDLGSANAKSASPVATLSSGITTRRSLGQTASAGAIGDESSARARPKRASTGGAHVTSSQQSLQSSQPELLPRATRNSGGRASNHSSGTSSTPAANSGSAGASPVTTRHSARLQGESGSSGRGPETMSAESSTTTLVDGIGKGGSDDPSKEGEGGPNAKVTSWRDKVFLTSGIYSDDFREGRGRKRKRKRALLERRRAAGEAKRARTHPSRSTRTEETSKSSRSNDRNGSDDSESDASMSSLSSMSESEDDQFLPEHSSLPLPDHYGFFLLIQDRDFRLTYNILQEADEMRARADAKKKPRPYQQITTNRYVTRPKLAGEVPVCQCVPPPPETVPQPTASSDQDSNDEVVQIVRRGCGDDCINRQLQYVCDPRSCPCGEQCSNLSLGKRPFPKLDVVNYGQRGFGLRTPIALHKDQFLGEYRGEVIDLIEAARRTRELYIKDGNYYFLDYDAQAGEVLDAGMKGSLIRFANHSCSPNCYVMKWTICGTDEQLTAEFQIGMYAMRDIEAGEELTYDYGWSEFRSKVVSAEVADQIKCLCGAPNCVGTLGGKKSSPAELSKTGLGHAANQKKEKALRQQRKSASAIATGGSNAIDASTPTPTPDGTEETAPRIVVVSSADKLPADDFAVTSDSATEPPASASGPAATDATPPEAAEPAATVTQAPSVTAATTTTQIVLPNNPPQMDSNATSGQASSEMQSTIRLTPLPEPHSKARTAVIVVPPTSDSALLASSLSSDKEAHSARGSTASPSRPSALAASPVVEIAVPVRPRASVATDAQSGSTASEGSSQP